MTVIGLRCRKHKIKNQNMKTSKGIALAIGVWFLIFISIGVENFPNWKFLASSLAFR